MIILDGQDVSLDIFAMWVTIVVIYTQGYPQILLICLNMSPIQIVLRMMML
jgi:hypothetical protein